MRVLVLYAHPVETSFQAALHGAVVGALTRAGHQVDDCDLYAEGFDPVLSRQERIDYHDLAVNRRNVDPYVERVMRAEALVLVYPVWNFGFPAILKGFFDRVFLPGVSFRMENGKAVGNLGHIRKLAAVATYGGARWRALLVGDPPRKSVTRVLRAQVGRLGRVPYLTHYDMNRSTEATRSAFLERVTKEMERF
ncbi:NAD(P)H-dependent oxidoreductase [Kaistia nematophila]|uniref:NAD(P)H-dependent oxidoreductase n=1 Tax=Kaistia nematophila TaxID=2994654 RepID=A0A9X3E4Y4_9HYPH|nr:NAD(P)H-dependent oxidoreductase [Kaistia nematophila]MCX5571208.1 NAD(P)H-dependent oxidoreductase [Kaistia nematophila]